ncbi:MAG: hypothetical protein U1F43_29775 [Myxococcota bacterium]
MQATTSLRTAPLQQRRSPCGDGSRAAARQAQLGEILRRVERVMARGQPPEAAERVVAATLQEQGVAPAEAAAVLRLLGLPALGRGWGPLLARLDALVRRPGAGPDKGPSDRGPSDRGASDRSPSDRPPATEQRERRPVRVPATGMPPARLGRAAIDVAREARRVLGAAGVRPSVLFVVTDRVTAYGDDGRVRGVWQLEASVPLEPGYWLDGSAGVEAWSSLDERQVDAMCGARGDDVWVVAG